MAKMSFGQLEEAKSDPRAFRTRLAQGGRSGFGATYHSALRDAIFQYHSRGDQYSAKRYLEDRLGRFKDPGRIDETLDQFDWYLGVHSDSDLVTFQIRLNIEFPLFPSEAVDLRITGQVSRLDLSPDGGYVAWLFRSGDHDKWEDEIRLPLIQHTLSNSVLACPLDEITMGIISFNERFAGTHSYSESEVEDSIRDLLELLSIMGYGLAT